MQKTEIEEIVQARLNDAEVLLEAFRFDGSVYPKCSGHKKPRPLKSGVIRKEKLGRCVGLSRLNSILCGVN